ncbi:hypothetical protein IGA_06036 [Bacillus cereus HuA3-9]|uniref:Transposase n=2 Tax=Bacillus TaxID=1386 RepID=R8CGU4_BACCE|nr:hypothetical protein IGA_06036 [Bacillus cereus HuA3-9]
MVRRWKEIFDLKGVDFLYEEKKGGPAMENINTKSKLNIVAIEVEALQEENERLRMEINYLKKLKALVQKEKKLQNTSKRT